MLHLTSHAVHADQYPERLYHLTTGATAVDFSNEFPNFLAVGLYDGNICIFDVASGSTTPMLTTLSVCHATFRHSPSRSENEIEGRHTKPVWSLQWVLQPDAITPDVFNEILVSTAADGRVLQWSLQKGLNMTELMLIKRVAKDERF